VFLSFNQVRRHGRRHAGCLANGASARDIKLMPPQVASGYNW
jgi:hypothetical protein